MNTDRLFAISALGICAIVASLGCKGSSRPEAGDYVLQRVDGKKPPMILTHDAGCTIVVISSVVRIDVPDTYASSFQIMRHCADSVSPAPDAGTHGPFSTKADTLYFGTADGRSGGLGVFHKDTIAVRGTQHELIYVKKPAR